MSNTHTQEADMAEGGTSKLSEVIDIPDDDPNDFPDLDPQNPAEAQSYKDKIDIIMDTFSELLQDDRNLQWKHSKNWW